MQTMILGLRSSSLLVCSSTSTSPPLFEGCSPARSSLSLVAVCRKRLQGGCSSDPQPDLLAIVLGLGPFQGHQELPVQPFHSEPVRLLCASAAAEARVEGLAGFSLAVCFFLQAQSFDSATLWRSISFRVPHCPSPRCRLWTAQFWRGRAGAGAGAPGTLPLLSGHGGGQRGAQGSREPSWWAMATSPAPASGPVSWCAPARAAVGL